MTQKSRAEIHLLSFWGPELRLFLYSGLAKRLQRLGHVVLLSRNVGGGFLSDIPPCVELRELQSLKVPPLTARTASLVNTAHALCMDKHGMSRGLAARAGESPDRLSPGQKVRHAIARGLRHRWAITMLKRVESWLLTSWIRRDATLSSSVGRSRKALFVSTTDHPIALALASLAKTRGGHSVFVAGNWKDVSRGFPDRSCWERVCVWSDAMKEQLLLQNPGMAVEKIRVVGSPQFDLHFSESVAPTRGEFCRRLGLDETRPIVLYTAAARRVIPHESATVAALCRAIDEGAVFGSPSLVVRLNPTGSDPGFEALAEEFDFLRLSAPQWEYRTNLALGPWHSSAQSDVELFSGLLRNAAVVVGAPSTIVLDCAVVDSPFVSVLFDPPGTDVQGRSVTTFADQDVFRPAVLLGACRSARSLEELVAEVNTYLSEAKRDAGGRQALVGLELGENHGKSVDAILSVIQGLC